MSGFGEAGAEEFWLAPPDQGCDSVQVDNNFGDVSCASLLMVCLELRLGLGTAGDEKQVLLLGRTKLIKLRKV